MISNQYSQNHYQWLLDNKFNGKNTAIIVIDMQRDFLSADGYFSKLGEDISHLLVAIEPAKKFLHHIRKHKFLIIHTRESHRPELADLQENKRLKSEKTGSPVGMQGPLGRLLVRGEKGCVF